MNAATYMGVLEPLRKAFAKTPEARERGLKPTSFSFNSAAGACPVCEGAGYEKVEMQFLPDAFVKCGACDGRRFRPEVLEVRCRGLSIADALDLPAADVARLFGDAPGVRAALQPMLDLGLGYLSLSQPAPTLSGGEAQRLKLARALAEAGDGAGPAATCSTSRRPACTPADVAVLVGALHRLVDAGHSVVVVEHDTEVARAADWILDLGPEAGDEGGRVVGEGAAGGDRAARHADRPRAGRGARGATRPARRAAVGGPTRAPAPLAAARPSAADARSASSARASTTCSGSTVDIPRDKLVAVTGVSGSGKSTLAFDVLFAEGQRRFLDCLSTYVRQFIRPARPARGGPPRGRAAHRRPRAEALARHAALDRRHRERGLPPPAPALVARSAPSTARSAACPGRWWTRPPSPRAWPRTSRPAS